MSAIRVLTALVILLVVPTVRGVDLEDFAAFELCLTGPGGNLGVGCGVFDFDADGDVDLSDHAAFQRVFMPTPPGMVEIPGGTFSMGDSFAEGDNDELPVHTVTLSPFYMDIYEVTNQQYADALNWALAQGLIAVSSNVVIDSVTSTAYCDTVASSSYSRVTWDGGSQTFGVTAGKEDHPMVRVSWYGSVAYANWRSEMDGRTPCYDLSTWACNFTANGYRLPTEAEWEYAARGGNHSPYYRYPWGDAIDGSMANYWSSGDPYEGVFTETTPVGYYDGNQTPSGVDMANGYGLYDMAGNVVEWCNDWYNSGYYSVSPSTDPTGPGPGTYRVLRGGSWYYGTDLLRCAYRYGNPPRFGGSIRGFRLALD